MLRTLLHKTLLTAIAILLGGWAVVAQNNVVKGTALSFRAEENPAIDFRWEIYNVDNGTTVNLASSTNITEEYTFNVPGNFQVLVYPVDKVTRCLGEPAEAYSLIVSGEAPTLVFDDLLSAYACAESVGVNPRADIACTVHYNGPLPWKFKYSVDRNPAELAEGGDEIWSSTFDFVVTIPNTTGGISTSEIMIVDAQSVSGLKVIEDPVLHMKEIDIYPLPDTKFIDFDPVAMAGALHTYKANILRHDPDITPTSPDNSKRYEIFVPDGSTVLNESTRVLVDHIHSELTFQIQWGTDLGAKQVKLIEKNNYNCYGDTIYADINVVESFLVDLGGDKEICRGSNIELTPTISFDGNFTYKWSTGEETEAINVSDEGTYTLTVTETELNKTSVASIKVSHLDTPVVDLGADYELADGEVKTLDAGVGGTYLWSTTDITQTIDVHESGLYSVEVTGANNCKASDEIKITSVNDIFGIDLGTDIVVCVNDHVILNPNPSIIQNYKYLWSNGLETPTISVTESMKYSVVVTDDSGNSRRDEIEVLFKALPIVDLGPDQMIYQDETLTLDGGVGESYLWNTKETTQTIEVTKAGQYSLEITGSNTCVGRDNLVITGKEGHRFTVDLGDNKEICEGDRAYLEPEIDRDLDDPSYFWIPNGETTKGIYVDKGSKYCVEVSDKFGNKETACIDVDINPSPVVNLGADIKLELDELVVLDAGNDGVSYVWSINDVVSNKDVSSTLEVNSTGKYSVEVTGVKDCIGKDTVNVDSKGRRYLPSAFSPNSRQENNRMLFVKEKYSGEIKKLTFVIYNRGGQKIFQSNRIDIGWDGTYKGEVQRMDTYVYFLKITLDNNTTEVQRGEVTLLN